MEDDEDELDKRLDSSSVARTIPERDINTKQTKNTFNNFIFLRCNIVYENILFLIIYKQICFEKYICF